MGRRRPGQTGAAILSVCALFALAACSTLDLRHSKDRVQDAAQGVTNAITGAPDPYAVTAVRQYRVQPGDEIQVMLKGTTTLLGIASVGADGHANLPRKGDTRIAGMTLDEIAAYLEKDHGGGVAVTLRAPAPVFLVGEVGQPGQFAYSEGLTLAALIAKAGGLSHKADLRSVNIRPRGAPTEVKTDYDPNLPILPGDVVRFDERFF